MFSFYSSAKNSSLQRPQEPSNSQLNDILEEHCTDFRKECPVKQFVDASTNTEPVPAPFRDYRRLFKAIEDNRARLQRQEILQIITGHLPHVFFLAAVAIISAK